MHISFVPEKSARQRATSRIHDKTFSAQQSRRRILSLLQVIKLAKRPRRIMALHLIMPGIAPPRSHIQVIRTLYFSAQLDVIVREFADLDVVDAEDFFFFGSAEFQGWNPFAQEVEDAEDNAGHEEGVEAAGEGVGELVPHLDPVVVEPATFDVGEAVEVGDVVTRH